MFTGVDLLAPFCYPFVMRWHLMQGETNTGPARYSGRRTGPGPNRANENGYHSQQNQIHTLKPLSNLFAFTV
ncbi:hypothetical protein P7_177 [Pectobacterium phage vB_PcaM_P7_Pc]|nr:hypothetical protein P7_177 [Pectobacterium phage vB_PcaM_P7_Pc]